MVAGVPLVIMISAVIIMLIMLAVFLGLFQISLGDLTEREDWDEVVFYAVLAVVGLVILSLIDIWVSEDPIPIGLNVTGVLVPVGIVGYILVSRRLDPLRGLASIALVAAVAFPLIQVGEGGAFIPFPSWLVPAGVAAACGLVLTRGREEGALTRGSAIAFASGSMGMLLGGDLLHLPGLLSAWGNSLVLGAGGILDFVFLTGVVAVSMVWTVHLGHSLVRRYFRCASGNDTSS